MKLRWALVTIVLVNLWILGQALINRTLGEPFVIELTEREMPLPALRGDNSLLSMSLRWQGNTLGEGYGGYYSSRVRLSDESYNALGGSQAVCSEGFSRRRAWLLLSYDGKAYRTLLERQREQVQVLANADLELEDHQRRVERAERNLKELERGASRLIGVDAALSEDVLHRRATALSTPYLILPARLYSVGNCSETEVRATLTEPLSVHLPREKYRALSLTASSRTYRKPAPEPRYRVALARGSLGLWWLDDIARCEQPGCIY